MVQEVRRIMMSLDEVFYAFECYQRITPGFLADCALVGCKTSEDAVVLTVDAMNGEVKERKEVTFRGIDVLKPMIRFCIENNIMLPRDGRKSFLIEKDRVVVLIELDLSVDMPTSVNPMNMNHADKMATALKVAANSGRRT
jgi:hypothetical protein